jgi:hypothetical protein
MLPEGWLADVQFPAGLWVRPSQRAEEVAAERVRLTELPRPPYRGLIVVGMTGRRVPAQVWQAVRRALRQVPEHGRAALRVRAISTVPSAARLNDLVSVEEIITTEPPPYTSPWRITPVLDEPAEEPAEQEAAETEPAETEPAEGVVPLEEYRDTLADQFEDLRRTVSDQIAGMPGSSREPSQQQQLLERRLVRLVATFSGLLASPLTRETVDQLGDVYVELAEFSSEVERARSGRRELDDELW